MKQKLDKLFDLRLDGELDRETFDFKRNDIQLRMNRLKNKVSSHEKADKSFNDTILGLLDLATQAGSIFEKSQNLELKRLLLKFVFERLSVNEGKLNYKLKFPFGEFVDKNVLIAEATKLIEPTQSQGNKGLQGNDNEKLQIGCSKLIEPSQGLKNQGLAKNFANPLQIGALGRNRTKFFQIP